MAIDNDWFIDYQHKLIVHATYELAYDAQTANFNVGSTVTATSGGTAVIVNDTDAGTTGTLDLVYVSGTFADNDTLTDDGPTPGSATQNGTLTAKTSVYSSRALYSFIQNTFDELGQMDDTVPMSAQTPTEFTLINGWFIDDESTKYLSGGAIATTGYSSEVRVISFGATYTSAVVTDIGLEVVGGTTGHTGTLLHYNNTTKKWYVRATDSSQTFNQAETVSVTAAGGTGTGTSNGASVTGEDLYANIYTLGTIAIDPKPKTYVFQNGLALEEWWGRGDTNAHIDVLIKVREAGVEIDGAEITVFVRHFGDLFDHFPIDLTTGGRNAVPLATATDLNNNVTGEITIEYENLAGGTFTVGNFIRDEVTGAYGEIFADASSVLTIGNVILGTGGDFTNSNGVSETTSGLAADDTGVTADITASGITPVVRNYNNIKILFMNLTVPFNGGSVEPSVGDELAATGGAVFYYISSTLSSGSWTGGDATGTMFLGNWDGTSVANLESIDNTTTSTLDIATITGTETVTAEVQKRFEQGTLYPYNVVVDCANRTMAEVYEWFKYITREDANSTQSNYQTMYRVSGSSIIEEDGEEYIAALSTYSPVKASPFGTLAGGKLFAARGVWVEGMSTADRQNFQLIDAGGATRTPPNFITITVSSVVSGDKVTVFRTTTSTTINKTQFAAGNANTSGASTFYVGDTIPSDTPNSGYIRVVDTSDTSINRERRYAYSSWSNTTSSFTLSGTTVLDRTYSAGEDSAYVPYYDEVAGNTSVYVTVIYNSDQSVLTRVRRYGGSGNSILPFEITGSVGQTGYSVAAIRTLDTIVT
jgi:hypothetical protein